MNNINSPLPLTSYHFYSSALPALTPACSRTTDALSRSHPYSCPFHEIFVEVYHYKSASCGPRCRASDASLVFDVSYWTETRFSARQNRPFGLNRGRAISWEFQCGSLVLKSALFFACASHFQGAEDPWLFQSALPCSKNPDWSSWPTGVYWVADSLSSAGAVRRDGGVLPLKWWISCPRNVTRRTKRSPCSLIHFSFNKIIKRQRPKHIVNILELLRLPHSSSYF